MEELIVRIENVLNQTKDKSVNDNNLPVKIGSYHFHSHQQLLKHQGEEKKLSFRESELLKLLYLNRDNIIGRKEILMLLWGNDNFFNSRNLDVYITKLRSYLKHDHTLQIITIKGVGYRFITT
jgi:DNA-binding response OmpR family regulator